MNPRTLLLLMFIGLFARMWSGDAEHQSQASIARRAMQQQKYVQRGEPRHKFSVPTRLASHWPAEGLAGGDRREPVALAECVVESAATARTGIGWECFPECRFHDDKNGADDLESDLLSGSSGGLLITNRGEIEIAELSLRREEEQAEQDFWKFGCCDGPATAPEIAEHVPYEAGSLPVVAAKPHKLIAEGLFPLDELQPFGACDVPLPNNLAAGNYRVISDRGEDRLLTFTSEDLFFHGVTESTSAQDIYIAEENSRPWYFIRLWDQAIEEPTEAASIDWQSAFSSITGPIRCDVQFTAWHCGEVWGRYSRRINAVRRRALHFSNMMSEAILQALERIEERSTLSAERQPHEIRL